MSGNNGNDWKEWSQHVLFELTRLNEGQTAISAKISSIDTTLAGQAVELKEHMRRTAAGEANLAMLEAKVDLQRQELTNTITGNKDSLNERYLEQKFKQEKLADDVKSIRDIPVKIYRFAKWITSIAAAGGAVFTVLKFFMKVI